MPRKSRVTRGIVLSRAKRCYPAARMQAPQPRDSYSLRWLGNAATMMCPALNAIVKRVQLRVSLLWPMPHRSVTCSSQSPCKRMIAISLTSPLSSPIIIAAPFLVDLCLPPQVGKERRKPQSSSKWKEFCNHHGGRFSSKKRKT
ncbi:Hypothetical protein, putative [Bodo saltans]|uniref:Uncharacterized protein n=1 Tax=Bodo saltans TaxID=75058 RepID=A0A0S4ILV8_BODSA|nr:Hypothetical protein, putative [Bodo saltans]|eukprot:CUE70925.1 Hypothetical protein, putative [Bodo saltans]